jgi:diguanylate cyclase (GGDEF)-like protein
LALTAYSKKIKRQSETDALTGLNNRHYLRHSFLPTLKQIQKVGVIIADIDHFKSINDQFGHDVGDDVIHRLGAMIRQSLPQGATAIRYGGEEFLVLLPNTSREGTELYCQYLKNQCEKHRFEHGSQVTLSLGYWHGAKFDSQLKYAISEADMALYNAKQSGRNQVQSAL